MSGLHRVTAIGGNPLRNLDFYRQTLGLRLVKRTINFGEPGTITSIATRPVGRAHSLPLGACREGSGRDRRDQTDGVPCAR